MQPTPRLRVLFDRILRVLVFVYFCRVYIEILTGPGVGRPPSPLGGPPWYKQQSQNRVHHYKDLVELIKMHILFPIFGVRNQEILIKEGLHIKELRD